MANASKPLTHTTAVVAAAGTSVAPTAPVPDNCKTVIVVNRSSIETAYVAVGAPGGALTGSTASAVPPLTSLALDIGTIRERGTMDQATIAGSGLVFDASAAMTVEITYLNKLGGI